MFKVLRKALLVLLLGCIGVIAYAYLRNDDRRRQIAQKAEELHEDLKEDKKGFSWTGTAVVGAVVKGDRAKVDLEANRKVLVRLAGIDAPELAMDKFHKGQPLAEESRDYLKDLVKGKAVEMSIVGTDEMKTPMVLLTLDGALVNAKVAEAGYAEVTPETLDTLPARLKHALQNAELSAKRDHRGIWALTNYVRPVEFRIRNLGRQLNDGIH